MEDEHVRNYIPDNMREMVSRLQLEELRKVLMSIDHDIWGSQDDLRRRVMDLLSFRVTNSQTLEQTIIQVYKQTKIQEPLLQSPHVQLYNHFSHYQLLSHSEVSTSFLDKREIEYPRSLPFYEIKMTLIKPFCYKGKSVLTFDVLDLYSINPNPKKYIGNSYNFDKKKHKIQIILRIETVALHDEVYLPCNIKVVLNNRECKLPRYTLSKINANERQWRISVPINLNKYIHYDWRAQNELKVTWSDPDTYIVGVFLAEKLTCEELIEKLRKRPFRTIETSKEFIKNFMDNETDIVVDSLVVTLEDPLTTLRMTLPARGVECMHIQCFDAMQFLKMNENMQTWKCPICRGKVRFENIEIDEYFLNIIQSSILSEGCDNIILFKDGTWIEKKPYNNSNNNDSDDKEDHLKLKRFKYNPGKEFCENYNTIINPTITNYKNSTESDLVENNLTSSALTNSINKLNDRPRPSSSIESSSTDMLNNFNLPNITTSKANITDNKASISDDNNSNKKQEKFKPRDVLFVMTLDD